MMSPKSYSWPFLEVFTTRSPAPVPVCSLALTLRLVRISIDDFLCSTSRLSFFFNDVADDAYQNNLT